VSAPVLGGAAVVSSPALWDAFVEGTTSPSVALLRFLASLLICWLAFEVLGLLVGPAPKPEPAEAAEAASEMAGETPQPDQVS
jgi:hypothetical protein